MRTGVLVREEEGKGLQSLPMIAYNNIPHEDIRGMNNKVQKDGKKLVTNTFLTITIE